MEKLIIFCEECTIQERLRDKYAVATFESLTMAVNHIIQYGHVVKIEIEPEYDEE